MRIRLVSVALIGLSMATLACSVPAWASECPVLSALTSASAGTPQAVPFCDSVPGDFIGAIYVADPDLAMELGCPVQFNGFPSVGPFDVQTSFEPFENGWMLWVSMYAPPGEELRQTIFVLLPDGSYQAFDDHFDPSVDPFSGGETPPTGLFEPILGFGKLWRENAEVRELLGWATAPEAGAPGQVQPFEHGVMIHSQAAGGAYILFYRSGTWDFRPLTF